ncbi:MAG: protein-L-isoaspartate(D-aspartate) O-methyltransferase [Elusimicrobia bacterium]|nr:protein-L-isoaspartate(D-aspartate) O-methyltransferase [Elusimicrobiota bacterium]
MLIPKRRQNITQEEWARVRSAAVDKQIAERGITDIKILEAMKEIPRHEFLPAGVAPGLAYADRPLPIGCNQTVSQPYIVAYMAQQLALSGGETILEIGTGCGYEAAVLSRICKDVISLEIIPELAQFARKNLDRLRISNVEIHVTDGFQGWMPSAPYERIISACAMARIPAPLMEQLSCPGRLIAPLGSRTKQNLVLIEKILEKSEKPQTLKYLLIPVNFVPMRGAIEHE